MDSFDIKKLTELQRLVYKDSILTGYDDSGKILFQQQLHKYEKVITIISFLRVLGINLIEDVGNEIIFKRQTKAQNIAPMLDWSNASKEML